MFSFPIIGHGDQMVSACFRRPTVGRELDMLMEFVQQSLPKPYGSERLAVFMEPQLETGFPDAVAVYWAENDLDFEGAGGGLTAADDRLLHIVWLEGSVGIHQLALAHGRKVAERVRELVALGVLADSGGVVRVADDSMVLTRVIAIEAKMAAPSAVLTQAARNMWFASESYALLKNAPKTLEMCRRYESCGVGLLTPDDFLDNPTIRARDQGLPQSYATWRFNRLARELSSAGVV